jgi:hypothetical protein
MFVNFGNFGVECRTTFVVCLLKSLSNVGFDGRTTYVCLLESFGNVGFDGRTTYVRLLGRFSNVGVNGRTTFVVRVLHSLGTLRLDGRCVDDREDYRRHQDNVKGVDNVQSQQAAVEPLSRHLDGINVCLKPLPKG